MKACFQCLAIISVLLWCAGCTTVSGPLATLPMMSPVAAQHNLEGINQYNAENWEKAQQHFESAVQTDPTMPEAHFNLALTLHKLGQHKEATRHFKQAGDLAPANQEIVESSEYRNHLGLSSTFERHISGGYRY